MSAADIEFPPEVVFDLGARPRFADLAQVIDHRPEQRRDAADQWAVTRPNGVETPSRVTSGWRPTP
jgi:hypothetical protein